MKLSKEQISKVAEKGISGISGISDNSVLKEKPKISLNKGVYNIPHIPHIPQNETKNEAKPQNQANIELIPVLGRNGLITYTQDYQKFPFINGKCPICGALQENQYQENCGVCLRKAANS